MNKMVEYESHGNELDMRLKSIQEEAQLLKSENGKLRKLNQQVKKKKYVWFLICIAPHTHIHPSISLQLTSDNAILRENFNNTDSDNQTLRRRIDDLSVEIVSLVNAKSALLAEKEGKMLEIEKLQKQ